MNALILVTLASLSVFASAVPSGIGGGAILKGPSGIVTPLGPIGPDGNGPTGGDGSYYGGHGGGVVLGAPLAGLAVGPGLGLGLGGLGLAGGLGLGHAGLGLGLGAGSIGLGHGGVAIAGPPTVPATIVGPAGKIVASGLYGVPAHGHWGK